MLQKNSDSTLNRWSLQFGILNARDIRRQTQEILDWKLDYLKLIQDNDNLELERRFNRVYLDESYINANHSFMKGWHIPIQQGNYI